MPATFETRIVWGDCDEQGIVFYPTYFYWMDSAFQGLLRAAGQNMRVMREKIGLVGLPIVEANARFLASASYEDVLTVKAEIGRWGEKSFRADYRGFCGDRAIFEGFETRVWLVRGADGRPSSAPIPDFFKSAFAATA